MNKLVKHQLTNRERDILILTIKGLTNTQIASNLAISIHTVKAHLENIYKKLQVHNKTQAAVVAVFYNFIRFEEVQNFAI